MTPCCSCSYKARRYSCVLNAGGLRRGGLGRRRGASAGAAAGAAGHDGGSGAGGGAAPAGEREDLLAELVGLEEEPGPVLAQVLEQVLDLPLQPGDLALGEIGLSQQLRQLDDEADEVLGAVWKSTSESGAARRAHAIEQRVARAGGRLMIQHDRAVDFHTALLAVEEAVEEQRGSAASK